MEQQMIKIEDIAKVCHEANRAYCESLGDHSQTPWDTAPKWQQGSAIDGVNFHIVNPDAGDDASHCNWMDVKTRDGWVWGPMKDPDKREHPCLVLFDQLPDEQQAKDALFRAIVHALKD